MNFPVLPDKLYNFLKWLLIVAVPALIAFLTTIFSLYNIPNLEIVVGTISAVATLIGALVGISTVAYNKKNERGY